MPRKLIDSILALVFTLLLVFGIAAGASAKEPERFVGGFEAQPESRVSLAIGERFVRFHATNIPHDCETGPSTALTTAQPLRARVRSNGTFRRLIYFVNQYGTEIRAYVRGRISGDQAAGEYYESERGGSFYGQPLGPDCWTPGTLNWTAFRQ
ncbi:MAG: hypothetical protein QOI10_3478 [Solirubrobacterales bacterium]|nr:hypothetical protein [Solirubrobacterales bacterium]